MSTITRQAKRRPQEKLADYLKQGKCLRRESCQEAVYWQKQACLPTIEVAEKAVTNAEKGNNGWTDANRLTFAFQAVVLFKVGYG